MALPHSVTLNLRSLIVAAHRSNKPWFRVLVSQGQGWEGSIYRLRGSRNLEFFKGPQAKVSLFINKYLLPTVY